VTSPFVSYAQNHEDVVLARALRPDRRIGSWIDVGAGDPVTDSVTAAFSERGWSGINVEPLPAEHAALCAQRPADNNLPVALGREPGSTKLYEGPASNRGSSTTVPELAEAYIESGEEFTPIDVPVRTLAEITMQSAIGEVDFLKIDVEGAEADVLAGADWSSFRPRIVVVEATIPNTAIPNHEAWEGILLDVGYEFALFDGLNRFYVHANEPDLRDVVATPANVLDDYVPYEWARRVDEAARWAEVLEARLAECTAWAQDLERARAEAGRSVRFALDRAAITEEVAMDLRDDLAAAQLTTARALADAGLALDRAHRCEAELRALMDTRLLRHTAQLRRAYGVLRKLLS
jgi:FkbM family methyltransferase